MKMFLDVSNLSHEQLTGIGVYTKNLHAQLRNLGTSRLYPVCSMSRWHQRKCIENHISAPVNSSFLVPHLPSEVKLLHVPDHRVSLINADIRVQTIHDLNPLEEADYSEKKFKRTFKRRFNEILNNPKLDQVVTVSYFSKSRILDFYPHLRGRVKVIHLGSNHLPLASSSQRPWPWPYILFTGTLELRKNVIGLLKSFEKLAPKFAQHRLVLIGKEGYGSDKILKAIEDHPFKDRIVWKKFVSPQVLACAYKYAEVFVYPSIYEGFGLPIVEAMRYRCPVVCSNIPSLVEVGDEAIHTFDPHDTYDMTNSIDHILLNPKARYLLKSLADYQSQKYSWEVTARKTWDTYLELLRIRLRENLPSNHWNLLTHLEF